MKIVQAVRSDAFAGVERYICDVSALLDARGHEVVVVGGDTASMTALLPGSVRHLPAATTGEVFRRLARLRPDVVHAHMTAAETGAVVAQPLHRAPVIATRHFARPRGRAGAAVLTGLLASRLSTEIAISRFVAERSGPGATVLHNGVPDRPARLSPRRPPYVLMMQRLQPEKDPLLGLRAFVTSGLAVQGWSLVVVGRGPLAAEVEAEGSRLLPAGVLTLTGFLADPVPLLEGASALLAPAPAEPFGLSVVEAMSRGVPVLAAAGGAHLETVGEGVCSFPVGDVAAAAELLRRLAADPGWGDALGRSQRARQQDLFGLPRHLDRLVSLYEQARAIH